MSIKIITGVESLIKSHRVGIVVSRFHEDITTLLLENALDELHKSSFDDEDVVIVRVAGSWEIPFATRTLIQSGEIEGVITLGCLIKGETTHFETISNGVATAIMQSSNDFDVPITFGVLTCFSKAQALARADGSESNMGREAARALIQLFSIQEQVKKNTFPSISELEQ